MSARDNKSSLAQKRATPPMRRRVLAATLACALRVLPFVRAGQRRGVAPSSRVRLGEAGAHVAANARWRLPLPCFVCVCVCVCVCVEGSCSSACSRCPARSAGAAHGSIPPLPGSACGGSALVAPASLMPPRCRPSRWRAFALVFDRGLRAPQWFRAAGGQRRRAPPGVMLPACGSCVCVRGMLATLLSAAKR